ncbi:MAG: UTRA domain-containing protein [Rhodopseudomonas sp.]|nr:UTRA domain-containing protein [Rhodopseudomonas sp.]
MDAIVEPLKSHKVYFVLKEKITSGALPVGMRLASEPELAATYRVSRVTVRKALGNLEREGLIRRQPGAGTFVTKGHASKVISADLSDLLGHLVAMGKATKVRLLSFGYVVPPPRISRALGLSRAEKAQRSVRIRLHDGEPFSYLSTWVPEPVGMLYSETDLASTPLLTLLERSGIEVKRATQTIRATFAGPEVADALGVEAGASLLAVDRLLTDHEGHAVEYLEALYRSDRYEFVLDLVGDKSTKGPRWTLANQSGR